MKLATWNINSIRIRLDHVRQLVETCQPDVICFKETKVRDTLFPAEDLKDMGYPHLHYVGEKSYNGVAIMSKIGFTHTEALHWCDREDKRHNSVMLENGVELHNFYIPAGGDDPDPEANPKFAHKLQFLDEVTDWCQNIKTAAHPRVMVGDYNIAPLETDVWDHKKLRKVITHTEVEIQRYNAMLKAGDWVDAMRLKIPADEKCFTWWSYRARDWKAANKGRRLDHVWVSPDLEPKIQSAEVLLELRGLEKPSDHAPVLVEIEV